MVKTLCTFFQFSIPVRTWCVIHRLFAFAKTFLFYQIFILETIMIIRKLHLKIIYYTTIAFEYICSGHSWIFQRPRLMVQNNVIDFYILTHFWMGGLPTTSAHGTKYVVDFSILTDPFLGWPRLIVRNKQSFLESLKQKRQLFKIKIKTDF